MSVKVHEGFCIDSARERFFYMDHFLGDQVKDEWNSAGTGSAVVVDAQTGGIVRITTGATTDNAHYIDWQDIRSLLVTKKVTMEARVKPNQATYISIYLFLRFDGNNRIYFYVSEGAGGATSWHIACNDGGATTDHNSGVVLDTEYHIFRIECHTHGASHVHFYIDGVETTNSPITTNIPDDGTDYLQPRFYLSTREDVAKFVDIDYVAVRQER